jgi:hypothetical protein
VIITSRFPRIGLRRAEMGRNLSVAHYIEEIQLKGCVLVVTACAEPAVAKNRCCA